MNELAVFLIGMFSACIGFGIGVLFMDSRATGAARKEYAAPGIERRCVAGLAYLIPSGGRGISVELDKHGRVVECAL